MGEVLPEPETRGRHCHGEPQLLGRADADAGLLAQDLSGAALLGPGRQRLPLHAGDERLLDGRKKHTCC